jgi:hypothetical protein
VPSTKHQHQHQIHVSVVERNGERRLARPAGFRLAADADGDTQAGDEIAGVERLEPLGNGFGNDRAARKRRVPDDGQGQWRGGHGARPNASVIGATMDPAHARVDRDFSNPGPVVSA